MAPARLAAPAAFIATLLACSLAVQTSCSPDLPLLSPKLAWLRDHPGHDVVVIGTSHVYRSFVPAVFDAEVARVTGTAVRSFNLGVPALTLAEADLLVQRLPTNPPPRWVLLDANLSTALPGTGDLTRRAVAAATPAEVWLAWRYPPSGSLQARADALLSTLHALALRPFWSGLAAERLRLSWSAGLPGAQAGDEDLDYVVTAEGYRATPLTASLRPHERPKAEAVKPATLPTSPYREAMVARIVATLAAQGSTALLLETPNEPRPPLPDVPLAALDMGDLRAHPELYDADHQEADGHMNDAGARLATTLAADAFAAQVLGALH